MDTLRLILLFVHVLGFAALIGGALAQAGPGPKRVNAAMRDGAGTAFVAGLALVGVLEAGDADVDHAKIAVKLVVGLAVLGLVMANVRKEQVSQALWAGVLGLSVLNVAVAVFWSSAHV
ncbi:MULTISPECIES: hypothetical protein [Nocardioides]|uniref:Integral membrane protein n=1 Tax=Nocardioides salarius TaxID=374513 RepID=A0ABS2MDH4_9ACTN|nr:hypothetical protein [Nocardioides salarius]MBM7509238.1 hypothetical protein [Nocardioides salarius]